MPTRTDTSLLEMALVGYKAEREKISEKIAEIQAKLNGRSRGGTTATSTRRTRKPMSASARRKIAAAQKKRWAKFHRKQAKATK